MQDVFEINPLYFVSLTGYTWACGLKYTNIKLQTLQDEDMIFIIRKWYKRWYKWCYGG